MWNNHNRHIVGGNIKWYNCFGKGFGGFYEVEHILLPGTSYSSPREMKTFVHKISCGKTLQSSFIHNSQYWIQLKYLLSSEW